jgi:hypothetical protein
VVIGGAWENSIRQGAPDPEKFAEAARHYADNVKIQMEPQRFTRNLKTGEWNEFQPA